MRAAPPPRPARAVERPREVHQRVARGREALGHEHDAGRRPASLAGARAGSTARSPVSSSTPSTRRARDAGRARSGTAGRGGVRGDPGRAAGVGPGAQPRPRSAGHCPRSARAAPARARSPRSAARATRGRRRSRATAGAARGPSPGSVLDARAGAELEPPPGLLQAPAEVGVLGRAHPLVEAADLLERGAADQQVGRDGPREVRMGEVRLLAEEVPGGAVPRGERRGVRPAATTSPASAPTSSATGSAKYASSSVGGRAAVGVQEQDPVGRARSAPALRACAGERSPRRGRRCTASGARRRPTPGVVGEDQLVALAGVRGEQRRDRAARSARVPANGITTVTAGRLTRTARRIAGAHARPAGSRPGRAARAPARAPADGRTRSRTAARGIAANAAARVRKPTAPWVGSSKSPADRDAAHHNGSAPAAATRTRPRTRAA